MISAIIFACCLATISCEIKPKTEHVLGGFSPMDLSNRETNARVQNVSKFAMKSLNEKSNDLYHHAPLRVLDAKSQVVAGTKYVINIYTGQTTCAKNQVQADQVTGERCPLSNDANAKFSKCEMTVWEKPWENFIKLLNDNCTPVARAVATAV